MTCCFRLFSLGSVVTFVVRRLGLSVVVLAGFSFLSFWFFSSKDDRLKGHPVLPEYWRWLRHGVGHRVFAPPVADKSLGSLAAAALGHTMVLLIGTFVLVVVLSVLVGVVAALWRGSAVDLLLRCLSYVAWGVPAFLLALAVQVVVNAAGSGHGLGPFPLAGWPGSCPAGIGLNHGTISPCPAAGSGPIYVWNLLRYLTLPTVTLAVGFVGLHGRYLRAALLEILDAPFITTARAKGLTERRVLLRHALRVSLSAFVSALLADFGAIFGAALAVDWVFQLNGLGSMFVREFPTESFAPIDAYSIELVLLVAGALVLLSSLLSEIALVSLDPRVRLK